MKLNNNMKINSSFERIKKNFIYNEEITFHKDKATRKGIAFKTILLLCITMTTSIISFLIFNNPTLNLLSPNQDFSVFLPVLLGLTLLTYVFYVMGLSQVKNSQSCAIVYSFVEGIIISIFFVFLNRIYSNWIEIAFIAIFATITIFVIMAHAFYKGFLQATDKFKKIMSYCSIALICAYVIRLWLTVFGIGECEQILKYSMLTIPISLFMLVFISMFLILHFDYTEKMIHQGMPAKYEWQVSLAFASTLICIFIRVMDLFLKLFGDRKNR